MFVLTITLGLRPGEATGPLWEDRRLIFPSEAGTPLDPSNVPKAVNKVAKAAGIAGKVKPYTAGHSAAPLRLDAGQPFDQVADLLGDEPSTVLLHYRHRPPRDRRCGGYSLLARSASWL